ncbi:TPA: hypothetical protein DDW69_04485 [candidate division CPR2 bacterium]|uniref:Oxidoreductase FAD/NAD(P)-binding domain protein n=1 Tax=candidate division CPR2 bacterium GW2011_GWC1_41_48 TaxID=1618344 RepID=A0A0G0YID4_UNCC2|nr:MAG: Oxidoreductase FAD/NAD(P)-binding domain protein [candidate division CPR2 bacterium GW2011_GWC2_39_35]KKR28334.1 MAG: Oxidoreductase FAD/NAD(P)-binding domain protein [candidate division CPR2 bacterium GW2011_GWD1_39_7]KKR29083.1 MAG: Oxidoreductase FAD/NAD(P)-binding domain protein [candidate division CPR2 bacterium GW2011_GWD2_39_7]KKS09301.1 MAG: Oxidoreductase FAD/NAD(P)-binding domain protein [candidate division CPR2 bacterium GW2011_GWC1_41_48]OGB60576.1 MAG: hypothetical protein 
MPKNLYYPNKAKIIFIEEQAPGMRLFGIRFSDKNIHQSFNFVPGQFVFLSLLGHGEFPVSISSHPNEKDCLELLIRNVGAVTGALFGLNVGAEVGIRGPFGNGFDIRKLYGKDLVVVAGGCGVAPLRSLMKGVLIERKKFNKIYFLYGARTPKDMLFKKDIQAWRKQCGVYLTVDEPDSSWKENVGLITTLFGSIRVDKAAVAVTCGSPAMFKFVLVELKALGLKDSNIYLSLERRMKCGIGKCQHCTCGDKYVCLDGPVFAFSEIKENPEVLL